MSSANAVRLNRLDGPAAVPGGGVRSQKKTKTAARNRIVNAMTVDVEDYFQVRAFANVVDRADWEKLPSRVERNTGRMMDLFAGKNVKATFFVLGWVAERFPQLVRRMSDSGHEVASHGYGHRNIDTQTPEEFRDDVSRTKKLLEDISGKRVLGYRAPTFSIGRRTWWAYEILKDEGYVYSSSVYPIVHDLYGVPNAPRTPFSPGPREILEIPMTTLRSGGRNYPASGGGYFRLLPYFLSHRAYLRLNEQESMPCIFYCHPWEIDPGQPRVKGASLKSRLRHYINLGAMERRIAKLLDDFQWGRMDEIYLASPTSRARET